MLTKFATLEILDAAMAGTPAMARVAHRAVFNYSPKPGFLYVRSRAISSRTNDNYDTFPADEIRKAWRTFIGKPVFLNHHNSNHRRARGVIIDAALHEDTNPDGSPDVWVELLHEVDAIHFPKLAQAILAGEVDRTSMGCDVSHSLCSFCGNKATVPTEYCFPPDSLVSMADGTFKRIQDIAVGDAVLTHDGSSIVSEVMSRPYSGHLTKIHRVGTPDPVTVTWGHPILANQIGARDESKTGAARYASISDDDNWDWENSESIQVGEWVQTAFPTEEIPFTITVENLHPNFAFKDDLVRYGAIYRSGSHQGLINWAKFGLVAEVGTESSALAVVAGLYLAEGELERPIEDGWKEIQWSFHTDESETLVRDLQVALDKLKAGQLRVYRSGANGISVRLSNAPLASILNRLCGQGSGTKCLSGEVMLAPREWQSQLISAYLDGDGWLDPRGHYEARTSSPILARQLGTIGARIFNSLPTVFRNTNQPGGPSNRDLSCTIYHVSLDRRGPMRGRRVLRDGYVANRVKAIGCEEYDGPVYNFEVEGQHSYVVDGMVVHNCAHIPRLKGKRIRRTTASGNTEDVLVSEICFGLKFFENSLLVEEPADPTAFFLGVDDRGLQSTAKSADQIALDHWAGEHEEHWPNRSRGHYADICPACAKEVELHGDSEWGSTRKESNVLSSQYAGAQPDDGRIRSHGHVQHDLSRWAPLPGVGVGQRGRKHLDRLAASAPGPMSFGHKKVAAKVKQQHQGSKLGYGETVAPPQVDTLRPDSCPICGDDSFNGEDCPICGYIKPPDMYMDPDLDAAKEMDLRQDSNVAEDVLQETDPDALLECDVCGHTVPDADGVTPSAQPGQPGQPAPPAQPGALPDNPAQQPAPPNPPGSQLGDGPQKPPHPQGPVPKPDHSKPAQEPPAGAALPKKKDDDSKAAGDGSKTDTDDSVSKDPHATDPAQPSKDKDKDATNPFEKKDESQGDSPKDEKSSDHDVDAGSDEANQSVSDKPAHEGDPCPSCGKGTLTKKEADEYNADIKADEKLDDKGDLNAGDLAGSDEEHYPGDDISDSDDADSDDDDKNRPPGKKKKQSTLMVDLPCWNEGISAQGVNTTNSTTPLEGVFSTMAPRPLMQALAEQQKTIEQLQRENRWLYSAVNRIATVAGLKVTADENNPANPVPSPASQGPAETTDGARQPDARADVTQIGGVPGATDVSADATDTVDSIGGVKADRPYNVSENVTAPVSGTEGPLPLDQVRTVPRIEFGDPLKPDTAFPLQGEWAGRATVGSQGRAFASLRLARLRIQAGISHEADDMVLAQVIGNDQNLADAAIASEIETLSKVVAARPPAEARTARRVQATQQPRTVPSMASSTSLSTVASAGDDVFDSAFAFEA